MNEDSGNNISKLDWDKNRKFILDKLQELSIELAKNYEGAIKVYNTQSIPNRIKLSAHSIREMMKEIPKYLNAPLHTSDRKLGDVFDDLKDVWDRFYKSDIFLTEPPWNEETILKFRKSAKECQDIIEAGTAILIKRSHRTRSMVRDFVVQSNTISTPSLVEDNLISLWLKVFDDFVEVAHGKSVNENEYMEMVCSFESILLNLIRPRPLENIEKLSQIIQEGEIHPTREIVRRALPLLCGQPEHKYFFENINSLDWLEPLEQEKAFLQPEDIIKSDDGVNLPYWPPAKYLIKVAAKKPKKVLNIILKVPAVENTRIHEDFVEAAIIMPPDISVKICKIIGTWLINPYLLQLPTMVANLAGIYFHNKKFISHAISLCEKLLDVRNSNAQQKHYRLYSWQYNDLIKLIAPNLISIDANNRFIELLCNNLLNLIKDKHSKEFSIDYSHIWRRKIETSNLLNSNELSDVLINWIIDLYKSIVKENKAHLSQYITFLFNMEFPIFCRIALHLLRNHLSEKGLIRDSLTNERLIKSIDTWREYSLLLQGSFSIFDESTKEHLLHFIDKIEFYTPNDINKSDIERRRHYRCYYMVHNNLFGSWKNKFEEMRQQYGEIDNPEFLIYTPGVKQIQPKFPISFDELKAKTIEEIKEFLITWNPPTEEWYGESIDGLTQLIVKLVDQRCQEFANNIQIFTCVNSSIAYAIIQGFRKALEGNQNLNWKAVLDFSLTIIANHEKNISITNPFIDIKCSDIKDLICDLLSLGFLSTSSPITLECRERVWEIICICLKDTDPDEVREAKLKNIECYQIASNSTRGLALQCAIKYGLWIVRIKKIKKDDANRHHYEELFVILDKHLDTNYEKSRAVHSVYGRWLPWLYWLDYSWTKDNIKQIFPSEASNLKYWHAAFDAYLLYTEAYNEVFCEIIEIYSDALNYLVQDAALDNEKPLTRLVDHIILFYLRGVIDLQSPLITKLYEKANLNARLHIINFMGRFLVKKFTKQAIEFWEFRVNKSNELNDWSELVEFGWWTGSENLPSKWVLEQAIFVLKRSSCIKQPHVLMERLIGLSDKYPKKVIEVFKLIVDKKVTDYGSLLWASSAEILIPQLMKTKYRKEVIDIIHKLASYGLVQFGQFL